MLWAQPPTEMGPDRPIDAAGRQQVIDGAARLLNEYYVFPDVAKRMEEAVRARAARGEYDKVASSREFAKLLMEHLQEVSKDKHLRVRYSPEPLPERRERREPSKEEMERFRRDMARNNFAFERVEILPGNIGYLKLNGFVPPEFGAEAAGAAFQFLANCDALIIDLRENGGGDPAMVAYTSSYLFDGRVHLNDIWWRKENRTEEFWTLPYVPGRKLAQQPVWVLTAARTFSGGEEFAYNLKNLKRATIVGETTGGGAHPVNGHRINAHFMIGVPFARAINPITKTNWEGTGVEPDIKAPGAEALAVARREALKHLLAKADDPDRRKELERALARLAGGTQ